jgi:HSP20 family protein
VAFARWDPIRDLLSLQRQLDPFASAPTGWAPPVDICETADRYVVVAEIPGLKREDVQIHVHDGRLTLSGARNEAGVTCEQYHRVERGHGEFKRAFELPAAIEVDSITADLREGVLTVVVPKATETSRRIRVA